MDNNTTQSSINKLLEVLDEEKFLKIINVSNIDHYIKKFTAYNFLQLFIIAQLNEAESLRDLSKRTIKKKFKRSSILIPSVHRSFLVNKVPYHQGCLKIQLLHLFR